MAACCVATSACRITGTRCGIAICAFSTLIRRCHERTTWAGCSSLLTYNPRITPILPRTPHVTACYLSDYRYWRFIPVFSVGGGVAVGHGGIYRHATGAAPQISPGAEARQGQSRGINFRYSHTEHLRAYHGRRRRWRTGGESLRFALGNADCISADTGHSVFFGDHPENAGRNLLAAAGTPRCAGDPLAGENYVSAGVGIGAPDRPVWQR